MRLVVLLATLWLSAICALGQGVVTGPGPDIADALRTFTGSDIAFIPEGHLKEKFDRADLSSALKFPGDDVMVLDLTGAQVLRALERSVSLYPQANQSFLHLSGIDVRFNKDGPPNKRIISATILGGVLSDTKTYKVAMPSSLARGTLGYFKIWDKSNASKTFKDTTMEKALKGKAATGLPSHWSPQ
jgi:2',3'-cyclic-nucleotide 2'-phosphodiesterase (5'-nucleotidase family)